MRYLLALLLFLPGCIATVDFTDGKVAYIPGDCNAENVGRPWGEHTCKDVGMFEHDYQWVRK